LPGGGGVPEVGDCGGDVGYGEADALEVAFAGDVGDFAGVRVGGEDGFSVEDFGAEFAGLFGVVGEDGDYSGEDAGESGLVLHFGGGD
jgi:hypothetical protein